MNSWKSSSSQYPFLRYRKVSGRVTSNQSRERSAQDLQVLYDRLAAMIVVSSVGNVLILCGFLKAGWIMVAPDAARTSMIESESNCANERNGYDLPGSELAYMRGWKLDDSDET